VELIKQWSLSMDDLLNLAVTHELGHALCNERNERKADANGEQLRKGQPVQCK
jgi:Zn-dependent peptidase ImmA (M78 family)